jgi:GTP cyclohydrolase I
MQNPVGVSTQKKVGLTMFGDQDDDDYDDTPSFWDSDDSESAEANVPPQILPEIDSNGDLKSVPTGAADPDPLLLTDEEDEEIVSGYASIEERAHYYAVGESIKEIIRTVGDSVNRDGLQATPDRVLKSWNELYAGYKVDIPGLFTIFDAESYDEMVLLKDISFYSMCEHHMLPFFGVAHVAYIPDKKIVGISKLARLTEAFARRLQNQERITQQVTLALMEHLQPLGAACVIEGHHLCMGCRGVQKPTAKMVTSSLRGVFKTDPHTRAEFFSLIKG